ncbi:MAG: hypothetical protein SWK90_10915 [Chloroflexota bacterium]|nr:hypothetical protein [Chloroflexota bacterium]
MQPNEKIRPPLVAPGDIGYMAALALATGLSVLPSAVRVGVIHQLSRVVGTIWYKANRGAVRRVRRHLRVLFNYEESDARLESLVRSQLILASYNALIVNLLPSLRDEHLANLLRIEGLHYVDEIQRQNEPVLLLGFHYGVYGYAIAATLSAQGYATQLVAYGNIHSGPSGTSYLYHKLYWPRVKRLIQRIKGTTIDPGGKSQPELRNILEQKKEIVHLLADQYFVMPHGQDPPPHLAPLHLLDHTVYLDTSGVRLAKQMGAQPLTALPVKDGHRQRILIEPMEWANDGTTTDDIAQDLQIYLSRLEQRLLEYPALWRDLRRSDLLPRMSILDSKGTADG